MHARSILVIATALLVGGAAVAGGPNIKRGTAITLRIQPRTAVCMGKCPDFDVTVTEDHRVVVHSFDFQATPRMVRTFDRTRDSIIAFRNELAPFRPVGMSQRGVPCPIAVRYPRYGASDYDILWIGPEQSSRLRACNGDKELDLAVTKALLDISLSQNGFPLTPKQLRAARACLRQKDTRLC